MKLSKNKTMTQRLKKRYTKKEANNIKQTTKEIQNKQRKTDRQKERNVQRRINEQKTDRHKTQ